MRRSLSHLSIFAAGLFALAGCQSTAPAPSGTPSPTPSTNPPPTPAPTPGVIATPAPTTIPAQAPPPAAVNVHATTDAARAVTMTVTASGGGVLSATGADGTQYTLRVPPNALVEDTDLTLTPLAGVDGLPFAGGLVAGAQIEPEGLRLWEPASLVITPPAPIALADQVTVAWHGDGSAMHLYPLATDSLDLGFPLVHFSGYAVVAGTPGEVDAQLSRPAGSAEDALEQSLQQDASSLRQATADATDTDPALQRFTHDLRDYYEQHVQPIVSSPVSSCDAGLADLGDVLGWERRVTLVGLDDDFSQEIADASSFLTRVEQKCWDEAVGDCLDMGDDAQRIRVLQVMRQAQLLGIDDPTRFDEAKAKQCVWKGSITYTVSQHLAYTDPPQTSDLSLSASMTVTVSAPTVLTGDGWNKPFTATTQLTMAGTSILSTQTTVHDEQVNTFLCGDTPATRTQLQEAWSSTSGTFAEDVSATLVRTNGTYLLVVTVPAGHALGNLTRHDMLADTCMPQDGYDMTQDIAIQMDVPDLGLSADGTLDPAKAGQVQGSTVVGGAPYFGQPSQGTLTWSLTRSAP
jgi:hypothetical protein